jgi:hypothetical protein
MASADAAGTGRSGGHEGRPDSADGGSETVDDALAELGRWAAETRVADAVNERRRAGWLARQAEAEITMAGVLIGLAERNQPVVVHLLDGRRHRGTIAGVGRDVVDLWATTGHRVLVGLAAIASVRADGDRLDGDGRSRPTAPDLVGLLTDLAAERTPVLVVTRTGSDAIAATLVAVGSDVLTLQGSGGGWIYVPLEALAEVSVPESG